MDIKRYKDIYKEKIKGLRVNKAAILGGLSGIVIIAMIIYMAVTNITKVNADFDSVSTRIILQSGRTETVGGIAIIEGDPDTIYENVTITATNGAVIILKDVHIRQTTDRIALDFSQDIGNVDSDNTYTLILAGDSIIESTYENATNPLIQVENNTREQRYSDPIRGDRVTSTTVNNALTITDYYDGTNYNGKLTLINAKNTQAAVIGSLSSDEIQNDLPNPGSDLNGVTWSYAYANFGGGDINIEGEPLINIINRGVGAAIGGGGVIYTGSSYDAAGSGKVSITGGTVRVLLESGCFGNGIGGGSSIYKIGQQYASSQSGKGGAGSDVVIKGGSLYIENNGEGNDFGRGLGNESGVSNGSLTDGAGNNLYLYVADVDEDEAGEAGGVFAEKEASNYGSFALKKILGAEDYTYKVTGVKYSSVSPQERTHINTLVRTNVPSDYLYSGTGYDEEVTDLNGNKLNTNDISGKLYFYVPATPAVLYDIFIDNTSASHSSIHVYNDIQLVSQAGYGTRLKVTVSPNADYVIDSIYYVQDGQITHGTFSEYQGDYYFDMPAANVTIYVQAHIPEYTITYMNTMSDSGVVNPNPTTYTVQDSFVLQGLECPGLTFMGWTDEAGNSVTEVAPRTTGDLKFYATWDKILYTVTFVDYDGSLIISKATTYGGSVSAPQAPVREHYTFTGWDKTFDNITESITVTAQYTEDADNPVLPYNVRIDGNITNGTVITDKQTAWKDEEIVATITSAAGYKLKEIVVTKADGSAVNLSRFQNEGGSQLQGGTYMYLFAMPESDVNISAVFEVVDYTITYINVGNNDHGNPTIYNVTTPSFILNSPTKDDYNFDGWTDENGNSITEIVQGTTGNLVLVGNWSPKVIYNDYRITINRGITHGTVTCTHTTANENELIGVDVVPDNGYRLKNLKYIVVADLNDITMLAEAESYTGNKVEFYMPAEDIIITAEFEPIEYRIVYVDVDNSNNKNTYTVEDEFLFNVPEKEGYVFDKWYNIDAEEITGINLGTTGNKIIIATWIKKPAVEINYNISVDSGITNGSVYADRNSALPGDMVLVKVTPEKGYVLDKIECIPDIQDMSVMSLYNGIGYLSGNTYYMNINTYADLASNSVSRAVSASMLDDSSYVFTMPANDIVITAVFKKATYNITYIDGGNHNNQKTYTIADEVKLKDSTKEGYSFIGWYNENGEKIDTIALGSYGNKVIIGKWKAVKETETSTDKETTEENESDETTPYIKDASSHPSHDSNDITEPYDKGDNNTVDGNITTGDTTTTSDIHNYVFLLIVSFMIIVGVWIYKKEDESAKEE